MINIKKREREMDKLTYWTGLYVHNAQLAQPSRAFSFLPVHRRPWRASGRRGRGWTRAGHPTAPLSDKAELDTLQTLAPPHFPSPRAAGRKLLGRTCTDAPSPLPRANRCLPRGAAAPPPPPARRPAMRVKRRSRHRKVVKFYSTCFGFREPYKVLVDGTFVHHLLVHQLLPADDALRELLSVSRAPPLLTSKCVVAELRRLGKSHSQAFDAAQLLATARSPSDVNFYPPVFIYFIYSLEILV